jgi:valyl-tRNA synthetase
MFSCRFIKCDKLRMKAIEVVEEGDLIIEPEKHKDNYLRWLNTEQ